MIPLFHFADMTEFCKVKAPETAEISKIFDKKEPLKDTNYSLMYFS